MNVRYSSLSNMQAVLLDACFLLALFDENDSRSELCDTMLNQLEQLGYDIYTSTHVHSETINRMMHGFFELDVALYVTKQSVFNDYISLLVDQFFDSSERISIIDWVTDPDRNDPCPVNLKRKFAYIYKSEYRDYLMPYLNEVNEIFDSYKIRYNIIFAQASEAEYYIAVNNMTRCSLLSQDAYHLAVCEANTIPHIITFDTDFVSSPNVNVIRPDVSTANSTGA